MKSKILPSILALLGFLVGASALSAAASWNGPACGAPGCNADAPINASSTAQTKNGPLTLNFSNLQELGLIVLGKVKIVDGNQAAGKVLTSDLNGVGTWQTPTGGSGGGNMVVTEYGPYYNVDGASLGVHTYCALSLVSTGVENHSVRVYKDASSNWFASTDFYYSNGTTFASGTTYRGATFKVMCFDGGDASGGASNWETGEITLPCQAYTWPTSQNITFTKTFTVAPKVFTQPKWERYTGNESAAWWVTNVTTTGFTMNYGTPNSGSCYPTSGGNGIMWTAIGQGTGDSSGGGLTVTPDFVLNNSNLDSQSVNMGVHKACFLKSVSGFETDTGRIACYILASTTPAGSHDLFKFRATCRAACID